MSAPVEANNKILWDRAPVVSAGETRLHPTQCLLLRGHLLQPCETRSLLGLAAETDDAAVVVAAYERWGELFRDRLSGWLSFVLWDPARACLLASADSFGHHPLFYILSETGITISFRVESLVVRAVEGLALDSIAAHLCGSASAEGRTSFRDVQAVPPGSTLVVTSSRCDQHRPFERSPKPRPKSRQDLAEQVRAALGSVVGDYTEDLDVVGITLSSGLDSTAIAAMLAAVRPEVRRVAFVWSAKSIPIADESAAAIRLAESLGMEVVEIRADLHAPLSAANSLMPRAGSPLCNIYRDVWLETFRQAAERGVRVVLTGQGGDLGFGGVFPFADLFLKGRWLRLANEVSAYRNRVEVDLAWLVRYRILGPAARWLIPRKKVSPPRWLGPALRDHTPQESKEDRFALPGRRDRKRLLRNPRRFAGTASLTEDAAEFGVEVRHPWVDPRVVELAEGAPSDWTFADGFHKAPIRDALRAELPSEITARAEKVYPDPIFRRALSGPGRAKIDALVESMVAQELGFIESRALQHAVDEYAQGRGSGIFWHALSLEAWLRGFDSKGSL